LINAKLYGKIVYMIFYIDFNIITLITYIFDNYNFSFLIDLNSYHFIYRLIVWITAFSSNL